MVEEIAKSEFFSSLGKAIRRGIRVKAIRVSASSFPEHWDIPNGMEMQFHGIPVEVKA